MRLKGRWGNGKTVSTSVRTHDESAHSGLDRSAHTSSVTLPVSEPGVQTDSVTSPQEPMVVNIGDPDDDGNTEEEYNQYSFWGNGNAASDSKNPTRKYHQ